MVYVREAGLDIQEVESSTQFTFARARHSEWIDLVRKGGMVMFAIPEPTQRQSVRWRINGALRSRGIKAHVRYALTPEGREVYVVVKR